MTIPLATNIQYKAFQDANRVELTAKANQCATLIDELRKIQVEAADNTLWQQATRFSYLLLGFPPLVLSSVWASFWLDGL